MSLSFRSIKSKINICAAARMCFDSDHQSNEPDYWAFQKFALENPRVTTDSRKNCLEFEDLDFGPFGASNVSIGVKPLTPLSLFKKKIRIYYDGEQKKVEFPYFIDETTAQDENIAIFGVNAPDGQHDTYIFFPENIALSDVKSVQFYTANPVPGQVYYLLAQISGKALTLANNPEGGNFTTNYFRRFSTQRFKFERVCDGPCELGCGGRYGYANRYDEYRHWDGGYKIVCIKNEKVLAVKDASRDNDALIMAESFTGVSHLIWYIQEFHGGFRFRSKFLTSKCLDVIGDELYDGARMVYFTCSSHVDVSMIWLVHNKVC